MRSTVVIVRAMPSMAPSVRLSDSMIVRPSSPPWQCIDPAHERGQRRGTSITAGEEVEHVGCEEELRAESVGVEHIRHATHQQPVGRRTADPAGTPSACRPTADPPVPCCSGRCGSLLEPCRSVQSPADCRMIEPSSPPSPPREIAPTSRSGAPERIFRLIAPAVSATEAISSPAVSTSTVDPAIRN